MSIESIITQYGLAAVFLGAGIEGETAVVTGGILANQGLLLLPATMVAAAAGSFVADQLFFAGGRHYRDHPRVTRIMAKPAFARAKGLMERHPIGFIFAFRFLYGLRTVSPIAIGTTAVSTRTFMILNAAAAALWGVLFSAIGYLFGDEFIALLAKLHPHGHRALWILGAAVILFAAFTLVRLAIGRVRRR